MVGQKIIKEFSCQVEFICFDSIAIFRVFIVESDFEEPEDCSCLSLSLMLFELEESQEGQAPLKL